MPLSSSICLVGSDGARLGRPFSIHGLARSPRLIPAKKPMARMRSRLGTTAHLPRYDRQTHVHSRNAPDQRPDRVPRSDPEPLRRLQEARAEARSHSRQAFERAARPVERPPRFARGRRFPGLRQDGYAQLRRPPGPPRAARSAGAALWRRAGTGHPRRQLEPGAHARRDCICAAQGHRRQPAPVEPGVTRRVSLPGARLRPPFRNLPGLRHRDDPGRARRRRAGYGRSGTAGRRGSCDQRASGACRSTAIRRAPSTRQRQSSGSRPCRRPRPTSASSGTTPTPSIT